MVHGTAVQRRSHRPGARDWRRRSAAVAGAAEGLGERRRQGDRKAGAHRATQRWSAGAGHVQPGRWRAACRPTAGDDHAGEFRTPGPVAARRGWTGRGRFRRWRGPVGPIPRSKPERRQLAQAEQEARELRSLGVALLLAPGRAAGELTMPLTFANVAIFFGTVPVAQVPALY